MGKQARDGPARHGKPALTTERHLITSALPYINGVKHLGNLIGSMLPADVYARFQRGQGHEVLFICATDEHGTPAELAAAEAGVEVAEYCREQHEVQREVCARFALSWDHFGRTSAPANHELTRDFAAALDDNGFLETRTTRQVFSVDDDRFLPDRYVIGTCPNCGYDRARGDQCEHCTKQLDPTELIDPRSAVSGSTNLEVRDTTHLFLLQSRLADEVGDWVRSRDSWSPLVRSIADKWLKEGVQDRSITRDLSWGVPVDADRFPALAGKVFYVWFDAPIGYLGASREWADVDPAGRDWRRWWRLDEGADDVTYTQFLGKDNVPFHTIGFPTTIIGSRQPWKLVDRIKGFSWLTYYGGKFSTSGHRGIFMDDAAELLPSDYWRWFLLSNAPETNDSNFTWETFAGVVNKELAGELGNLVNRVGTLLGRHCDSLVPAPGPAGDPETQLEAAAEAAITAYLAAMADLEIRRAAQALRSLWSAGNVYLEQTEPWRLVKTDPDAAAGVLRRCLALLATLGRVLEAFIPDTAAVLAGVVPLDAGGPVTTDLLTRLDRALVTGTPAAFPPILFRKIPEEEVEAWKARFGGGDAGPASSD